MSTSAEDKWEKVMEYQGFQRVEFGPYYSHVIMDYPRHLLFTLSRYKFVSRLVGEEPKIKILELGCNEGVATSILAEFGHQVTGIDSDDEAIKWAKSNLEKKYKNLIFYNDDFVGKLYGKFDVVVSLDVIEHIPKEEESTFFKSVVNNLKVGGYCIIGTPNITASEYASVGSKIGHVNLFSAERLRDTLRDHFENVFLFGMNDEIVHTGFYPMSHYLFGLGVNPRQTKNKNDTFDDNDKY